MKRGIAVDIDDTLSNTNRYWFEYFISHFGNPENLTLEDMIKKYRYVQFVSQWQTPESLEAMDNFRNSNEAQESLPMISGAKNTILKISKIVPIACYITVRPETVINGTKNWLSSNGFPEAEIILKPVDVKLDDRNGWKAQILQELYPNVQGIIDDSANFIKAIANDYKGVIFHYDSEEKVRDDINVIPCKSWQNIIDEVKKYFRN